VISKILENILITTDLELMKRGRLANKRLASNLFRPLCEWQRHRKRCTMSDPILTTQHWCLSSRENKNIYIHLCEMTAYCTIYFISEKNKNTAKECSGDMHDNFQE